MREGECKVSCPGYCSAFWGGRSGSWRGAHWVWCWEEQCVCEWVFALRCSHQVAGRCWPRRMNRWDGQCPKWSQYRVRGQAGKKREDSDHVRRTHVTSPGVHGQFAFEMEEDATSEVSRHKVCVPTSQEISVSTSQGHQCITAGYVLLKNHSHVSILQKSE